MDRIYPKPTFEFYDSSDSDNESKQVQSPRGESSSSSLQPSTRIPDSNRRVRFEVPTEPTLQRSYASRAPEPIEVYSLEQELNKAKLHINQAAGEMAKLARQGYASMIKEYADKGEVPPRIFKEYKLDELDVPEVLKRYKDTMNDR
ncbi:hypothetical protein [Herbaspirillum huttiense]|uniref:Uncharacterized protein n=2 Tax=Herbaspirillum huttiense TaxID=863372 RepID=A0AAJ2LSF3_9BURK|nr:hypothetical protein [Herbaspirillum huttiense]MDR9837797.1 hypothetical protein [Herbaspirillum huttiense]